MKIGGNYYKHGLFLAPLAGIGDHAFRASCVAYGAEGVCSELISAKAVVYGDKKTNALAALHADERPAAIQIFGSDPDFMAKAAARLQENGPSYIDINMGCPVPKLVKNGEGSALLKDPMLCGRIVSAVVSAVSVPVTVKIRSGFDEYSINAPQVAYICQESGASAVFVHARTRSQMYSGTADWNIIKAVKEKLSVPVIGNGDVTDGKTALKMLKDTGCDGIMIGRGAFGSPWVFADVTAALEERVYTPPPNAEKNLAVRRQLMCVAAEKGEKGMVEMRKHLVKFSRDFAGAALLRAEINEARTLEEMFEITDKIFGDKYIANHNKGENI